LKNVFDIDHESTSHFFLPCSTWTFLELMGNISVVVMQNSFLFLIAPCLKAHQVTYVIIS